MAAALPLAASALAACGSSGPGGGGDALDVWVYQDASTVVQEDLINRFNAQSDIDINMVSVPGENYQDRMRTAMGGGDAPDIFFNWGGGSISDFVAEDQLVDLTPYFEEDEEFRNAFVPTVLDAAAIDGRYYGVPMRGVQPVILFYNQTLFNDFNVEPPETYEDFLNLVDTFQDEGITPVALGGGDAWTELMWLEYLLDRQGGAEVFETIQSGDMSAWGDPAVLEAAQMAVDLTEMGAFGDNYRSTRYTNDAISTYFAQGEAAMHLMGSWEYSNQMANQPEFAENDLAYTVFPVIEGGAGDPAAIVGNPANYWSVNSQVEGERLDAAIEFLKMTAEPEYTEALIANGEVPAATDADELLEQHPEPDYARFVYDMVMNAPTFQMSWNQALPVRQATPMDNAIQEMFSGQLTPEEFVAEMQDL
jgi:xylobiose transport system substrate-binding protein